MRCRNSWRTIFPGSCRRASGIILVISSMFMTPKKNELWPRSATVNLSPTRSGKQRNCGPGRRLRLCFGIQNRSYTSRTREVFLRGDNLVLGSWTAGTKPNCRKVVVIADELCPQDDAHLVPLPGHGTTPMPLTNALTNCARLTSEQPWLKLITPNIAARE